MNQKQKTRRTIVTMSAITVIIAVIGVAWILTRSAKSDSIEGEYEDFRTAVAHTLSDAEDIRPLTDDEINTLRGDSIFNYSTSPDKTLFSLLGDVKTFRFVLEDTVESYPMVIDKMFCDRTFTYDRTGRFIDFEEVMERPGYSLKINRHKEFIEDLSYENKADPANDCYIEFYHIGKDGLGNVRCIINDGNKNDMSGMDRLFICDTYFPHKVESVYCNMEEFYPTGYYKWRIDFVRRIEYSDYDSHGNWLTAKVYSEGKRRATCTLDPDDMTKPHYTNLESPIGENIYYTVRREITYY